MTEPALLTSRDDHIVTLTMNRPEVQERPQHGDALPPLPTPGTMIDGDDDVRCAILTGAGDRLLRRRRPRQARRPLDAGPPARGRVRGAHPQRLLASSSTASSATGSSRSRSSPPSRATASPAAPRSCRPPTSASPARAPRFGVTEAKWSACTRRAASSSASAARSPTPRRWRCCSPPTCTPPRKALAFGLIGRIVPKGQALAVAQQLADKVAANGPVAVQKIKEAVIATECLPEKDALDLDFKIGQQVYATEDAREGPRAFKEKRTPNFKGK